MIGHPNGNGHKISILSELKWRGLLHQQTEGLADLLQTPQVIYLGIDATGDSLHVGHLLALTTLHRFQQAGHKAIVLIGGATGMIGDPSGKSEERNLLPLEKVCQNSICLGKQLKRLLDGIEVVNNMRWTKDFHFLEFLREIGKHVPINMMLAKDSVMSRLETGLSYTEFSYMLLQAYDFVHLHNEAGCNVQIGGSDQWGNITAGIDLGRRLKGAELHGLTCPLWRSSDGKKMGKTEKGAVWLGANKTPPHEFYQYWMNIADEDVEQCLRLFTDLDINEIGALMARHSSDPSKRIAQQRLAREVTNFVHKITPRLEFQPTPSRA